MANNEVTVRTDEALAEELQRLSSATPAIDIYDNDNEIVLLADLPGVKTDGLDVQLDRDRLTLEGTRQLAEKGSTLSRDFGPVVYRRTFVVPRNIDPDTVQADLTAGVLTLRMKRRASAGPRVIEVRSS